MIKKEIITFYSEQAVSYIFGKKILIRKQKRKNVPIVPKANLKKIF